MTAFANGPDDKPVKKTLVLHIGDHKTGSTTLQNAFATGQVQFRDTTVLYPARLNHNYLLGHFRTEVQGKPAPLGNAGQPGLEMLQTLISQSSDRYILISGEEFENISPEDFREVLERHFVHLVDEIRVVAYVRPHASRFLSNYTELVKIGGFQGDMDAYLDKIQSTGRFHFAPRFEQWQACFGKDFILRPMIREELHNGSVVDDFVTAAFDGVAFTLGDMRSDNESIGVRELMLLKFLQARFGKTNKYVRHTMGREVVRHMGLLTEPGAKPAKVHLHTTLAEELRARYREDAQALDAGFFGGRPLFEQALDSTCNAAKPDPLPLESEAYFSPGELRRLTALREVLWSMTQTPHNWAGIFHENRVRALHKQADVMNTRAESASPHQDISQ